MAEVTQLFTNEEGTERTYAVDELVEGTSGIVVASKGPGGDWNYNMQEPPVLSSPAQMACIDATRDFNEAPPPTPTIAPPVTPPSQPEAPPGPPETPADPVSSESGTADSES